MFRFLSIIVFLGILLWVFFSRDPRYDNFGSWLVEQWRVFLGQTRTVFSQRSFSDRSLMRLWLYRLGFFSMLLLIVSGFAPVVFLGHHLSGFLLLVHLFAAPVFGLSAAFLALLWAQRQQLSADELFPKGKKRRSENMRLQFWQRLYFWAMLLCSIPLIFSILISMYPLLGTNGQAAMLDVHRYSSLIITLLAFGHLLVVSLLRKAK